MRSSVMITGATRGVGRALVYAFAKRGFDIAFCSGNEENCLELLEELKKEYPNHRYFAKSCDVSSEAQIKDFVKLAWEALGSLKILINNAGFGVFDAFTNITMEDWQKMFAVNFMGPVMLCEESIPRFLQNEGYKYITVAASQSINKDGWNYKGRYSHKKTAVLSGLGTIGKSSMFLHRKYGANVRLGTVFTNCEFDTEKYELFTPCEKCDLCVNACPSGAISGNLWNEGCDREYMFDPQKCSDYMKQKFKHIGRGAVCGICMSVCPYGKND